MQLRVETFSLESLRVQSQKVREEFLVSNHEFLQPALEILRELTPEVRPYHNFDHTMEVIDACLILWSLEKKLPLNSNLLTSDPELKKLLYAAVYHDIGQGEGAVGHEDRGAQAVKGVLTGLLGEEFANEVAEILLATKMKMHEGGGIVQVEPVNFLAAVIQDADLFNLGATSWEEQSKINRAIYKELSPDAKDYGYELSLPFLNFSILLFRTHTYNTDSARSLLNIGKQQNLDEMIKLSGYYQAFLN